MRNINFIVLVGVFMFTLSLQSCGHKHSEKTHTHEQVDKSGPEYTSEFICPMHCKGSGSEEAGKCTVCGMKYVLNEDKDHSGHDHSHDHHDHDHGDHSGHNH